METKIEKLFTIDECSEIVKFIESKSEWVYIHNQYDDGQTFSQYFYMDLNDNDLVINKFKNYVKERFNFKLDTINIHVIKYLEGYKFDRHIDRVEHREKNKDFVFNINVVLNDEFEGGEFWLDDKLLVGNTPGMVYYYNSDQWHEVKPVTKGVRYSMLCYVRERDFVNKKSKSLI
jgi:predicted 2-oxoglutarate/Fe(II)-dependent dioxygenase YbiX